MQYRTDPKNGNQLSALGMGCMRLPGAFGTPNLEKSEALIMDAISKGINYFDTAYLYPGSENALGTVLHKNNAREKVYIATKLPIFKCQKYEDFDKFLNIQLERLRTTYIDYYFMHSMTKQEDWDRLAALGIEKWIDEKRKEGKIRQVGFSFHGQREAFRTLMDSSNWDFCMIQYNYINVNYQAGLDGLKYAHSKGMPVFIMEPLLGGRLAKGLPPAAEKLFAPKTPASYALRWLWNQPEVTIVLSGMSDMKVLEENAALAETATVGSVSEEELDTIKKAAEIFSAAYKIPCTGCNYCLPCPKKINIPDAFTAYNTSYAVSRFTGIMLYATTSGGFDAAFSVHDCTACGKCEKICPQHIPVAAKLKDVQKRMEPWWWRVGMKLVRKFAK